MEIDRCPNVLPPEIINRITELARAWQRNDIRPRVSDSFCIRWAALLDAWVLDPELPLYVRKSNDDRGSTLKHESGRTLVPVDNSPAHWSFSNALKGHCPTLAEINEMLQNDRIPISLVLKKTESAKAHYRCPLKKETGYLGWRGWKVAHIDPVGLRSRKSIERLPLKELESHFKKLIGPGNMFLIPKKWGGLAELSAFTEVFRRAR